MEQNLADSALKIGIIRLSSLGDIISTLVFLELIRAKFAQRGQKIEITFIVDTQFRGILADSAMIDRIIDLPLRASKKNKKLLFEIYQKTRQIGRFDILVDAQGLLKSALIGALIKKKKFVGFSADSAREKVASLFYNKRVKIPYNEHILKRQYELFRVAFDEMDWESEFRLEMLDSRNHAIDSSKRAKAKIAEILVPFKANKKILFLCEASKADKEFPLTAFYALSQAIKREFEGAKIFLLWDKNEREIKVLGGRDEIFYTLPHLNLDEIKALLGNMDLVIGGDTGITHTAWAMRVPSVTIYVSTDIKRFALEGEKHFSIAVGNSVLGMQFRTCENFGESTDSSLVLSPKFSQIQKPHRNHFDCDSLCESTKNNAQVAESTIDSAESQNLDKNNSVRSTQTRPLRGAKNREQGRSSASADFLLEADKRGTPSKSEKRQLLGTHFKKVGGSGAGGVALLRKRKNNNKNAESNRDSSRYRAQNDEFLDCHADSANLLAMTEYKESAESSADSAIIAQILRCAKKVLL